MRSSGSVPKAHELFRVAVHRPQHRALMFCFCKQKMSKLILIDTLWIQTNRTLFVNQCMPCPAELIAALLTYFFYFPANAHSAQSLTRET